MRWIGICDGNMQEGSFRCDANVSVRRAGETKLGTRCEIKNLNSFRFMQQAIEFEVRRQIELIEDGGTVVQETRLYDPDRDETRSMRSKEDAQDYRYFPDPDLPPLVIDEAWIERDARRACRSCREAMRTRFVREYALPAHDAAMLTAQPRTGRAISSDVAARRRAIAQAGRATGCWAKCRPRSTEAEIDIADAPVSADAAGRPAAAHRRRHDLGQDRQGRVRCDVGGRRRRRRDHRRAGACTQISDAGAIEKIVDDVLAANAAIVAEYRPARRRRSTRWSAR